MPGTAPTGWVLDTRAGITRSIVGSGIEDGIPYVDVRWQGTATEASPNPYEIFRAHNPALIPAVQGDVFTSTVYFRLTAGSFAGLSTLTWRLRGYTTGLVATGSNAFQNIVTVNDAPLASQRITVTNTLDSATAACVGGALWAYWPNGAVLDFTLRIGFPVTNRGAASLLDTVPIATLAARVGTTPQYGLLGLMREESTTNAIQNPRGEGAVAGTPGTAPTQHGFISTTGSGLTRTISTGVQNGLAYVDYTYVGTATAADFVIVGLSSSGALPAVAGNLANGSVFVSVFGSALPNAAKLRIVEEGAAVFSVTDTPLSVTAAPSVLRTSRTLVSRTITDGSTTSGSMSILADNTIGQALNFTIRVAGAQLVKNAPHSSLILPPVSSPAASTRAAEVLTLPDVSNGNYKVKIRAGSNTEYTNLGVAATGGTGLNVAWAAEAVAANESVVKSVVISPNI